MPTTALTTFSANGRVMPTLPGEIHRLPVALKASTTFAKGTIIGEVTASPGTFGPYSSTDVATPSGAPTFAANSGSGGPLAAGVYTVGYTYKNANGETLLSPTATVTITIGQQINVNTVGALPAGATGVNYYMSDAAGGTDLRYVGTNADGAAFAINAYPVPGAKQLPTTNTAVAASDGTGAARGILEYACTTDASGNITNIGEQGRQYKTAQMILPSRNTFNAADLTGLDALALTMLGGVLIEGNLSTGLVQI